MRGFVAAVVISVVGAACSEDEDCPPILLSFIDVVVSDAATGAPVCNAEVRVQPNAEHTVTVTAAGYKPFVTKILVNSGPCGPANLRAWTRGSSTNETRGGRAQLAEPDPVHHEELVNRVRRVSREAFCALPLRVHDELRGVPLRDVTVADLVGGGPGRTLAEARQLLDRSERGRAVRALFAIRWAIGRWFGWDRVPEGARAGPFRTVYELEREALLEVRNATVHAFLALALQPIPGGYRLYWAVYVEPTSWLTPIYMALIEPFRRFVVYPSLLGGVTRAWAERYATGAS